MPVVIIVIAALFPTPAYAYLDPGTGSIILQGLIASIAAVSSFFWLYWERLKSFFVKDKNENETSKKDENDT